MNGIFHREPPFLHRSCKIDLPVTLADLFYNQPTNQLMRKLLYLLLLSCFCQAATAQTSSITGAIRDTIDKKTLQHAVVTVLNRQDSTLVTFTRTDAKGAFKISPINSGQYVIIISYPKFADFTEWVTVPASGDLDMGTIPLTPKSVLMQEVIVRTNNAVRVKGDTTEFTADSFKVREGATVEELLRVMPGLQVNSKGEISAQGKRVDKVLVDGEEFFGEDPTIATQNIGAKAVDKVQVYDTKTEQDQLKSIGASGAGGKTINIKLKESAKKGYFGKLEGSTDLDRLNNAKMMYNRFIGNRKISVYGTKSNINTGSLGWQERNKLGIENDFEYDEIGGFYYSYGDGDNEFNDWSLRGIPDAYTAGALYGNKWNEDKAKLNGSYLYNRLGTDNTTRTIAQTILADTTFFNNTTSRSNGLSQQHSANGKFEWKLDSLISLKYTLAGTYKLKNNFTETLRETLDEESELVNDNARTNQLRSEKRQLDNSLVYKQLFKKKNRQLMATFRLGLIEDDQDGLLKSRTNFYTNGILDSTDLIDQNKVNTGNSTTFGTKITYNEPLNAEWNIVGEYSFNKNISESRRNSFDEDGTGTGKYTVFNPLFSNNFDLDAMSNSGTLTVRYVGKKLRAVFGSGLSAIRLNLNNLDLSQKTTYNFTGFTPQAQFGYKLKPQTGFSLSYRGNTVQPTVSQLQPLRNNNDPLTEYIGNPDLKVGFNHSVNLNFNDYKVLSGRYMFMSGGITFQDNAITNRSIITKGKTTNIPVNVNGNYNYYFWGNWNSGDAGKKLSHEIGAEINGGRNLGYLNGDESINRYGTYTLNYGIRMMVEKKFNFYIGPRISRNLSSSSLTPDVKNNYWTYGGRADGYVMLPWNLELSSDVEMDLRQKTAAFNRNVNVTVWNANLKRKFLKDKSLELGFIAHDILNQNLGFTRIINSNYISEEKFDRLARYFLFSVSWSFNKMPGGAQ